MVFAIVIYDMNLCNVWRLPVSFLALICKTGDIQTEK